MKLDDLDLESGRMFCRDEFEIYDKDIFTVEFLLEENLGDAWVSPDGEVFPFKSFCRHSCFSIEVNAYGPLRKSLEELGWLRLTGGDCFFDFYIYSDTPQFLTEKQKEILISLIDAPRFEPRKTSSYCSPNGLLAYDEELKGRL